VEARKLKADGATWNMKKLPRRLRLAILEKKGGAKGKDAETGRRNAKDSKPRNRRPVRCAPQRLIASSLSLRLVALWSFAASSHAALPCESANRFKPASRIAESGNLVIGVYLG
jgi:hypothetical protein